MATMGKSWNQLQRKGHAAGTSLQGSPAQPTHSRTGTSSVVEPSLGGAGEIRELRVIYPAAQSNSQFSFCSLASM